VFLLSTTDRYFIPRESIPRNSKKREQIMTHDSGNANDNSSSRDATYPIRVICIGASMLVPVCVILGYIVVEVSLYPHDHLWGFVAKVTIGLAGVILEFITLLAIPWTLDCIEDIDARSRQG
jgi:hypothetical protein